MRITAQKRILLTEKDAKEFYAVHADKSFFEDLVNFMISGPVVVQVLEGKDAISVYRNVMGSTNPKNADAGTIRAKYAESIEANSVHGSDSEENASKEINFFFKLNEIVG